MQVYKLFFSSAAQAKRADYYVLSYLFVGSISGCFTGRKDRRINIFANYL